MERQGSSWQKTRMTMKFNLGCGWSKYPGYVNVDGEAACEPDEVWNLETFPWPWPADSATEIIFNHSLEHMGGDPKVFLEIMKATYRLAAPGARIYINVPHPRHDNFLGDPTHVRPITPDLLRLFDRELNDKARAAQGANTPLAYYTGVDFRLVSFETFLDEPWRSRAKSGEISREALSELMRTACNVVKEYRFVLEARKNG